MAAVRNKEFGRENLRGRGGYSMLDPFDIDAITQEASYWRRPLGGGTGYWNSFLPLSAGDRPALIHTNQWQDPPAINPNAPVVHAKPLLKEAKKASKKMQQAIVRELKQRRATTSTSSGGSRSSGSGYGAGGYSSSYGSGGYQGGTYGGAAGASIGLGVGGAYKNR